MKNNLGEYGLQYYIDIFLKIANLNKKKDKADNEDNEDNAGNADNQTIDFDKIAIVTDNIDPKQLELVFNQLGKNEINIKDWIQYVLSWVIRDRDFIIHDQFEC